MAMSHDLDVVSLWPAYSAVRAVELLGKGDLGRTIRVLANAGLGVFGNPVLKAAGHIQRLEHERGIRSTWFVLAGTPTFDTIRAGDLTTTDVVEAADDRDVCAVLLWSGRLAQLRGLRAALDDYAPVELAGGRVLLLREGCALPPASPAPG